MKTAEVIPALVAGLDTALDLNDAVSAKAFLNLLDSQAESAAHNIAEGRLSLMQGALPNAKQFLESALRLDPASPEAAYWLAVAEHRSGDAASASSQISRILESHPRFLPALEEEMNLALERSDFNTALSAQLTRIALIRNPPSYEYGRLGGLWLNLSNFTEAEAALLKGLGKDPYCYACHFELGELYLRTEKLSLARKNFEWVVRFFPDADPAAFKSLATIDLMLGDTESARAVLDESLRLFPDDAALLKARAGLGR
jgi:tetratricopeptide (TPR) repeat protein